MSLEILQERALRELAIDAFTRNGYDVNGASLTKATLRQELDIVAGNAQYVFDFKRANQAIQGLERLRLDSSVYAAYGIRFGLVRQTLTAVASSQEYTFPNPNVFSGAGEADALEAFYNQSVQGQVQNSANVLSQFPTKLFRYVPIAQEGQVNAAYVDSSTADATFATAKDGYHWDTITRSPGAVLIVDGQEQIQFALNGPAIPAAAVAGGGNFNRVFMELVAFVATGLRIANR